MSPSQAALADETGEFQRNFHVLSDKRTACTKVDIQPNIYLCAATFVSVTNNRSVQAIASTTLPSGSILPKVYEKRINKKSE